MKAGKKFVFDVAWVLLANVSVIGVTFLQRMFIARVMGAEELGAYSIIMSIYAIGTAFVGLGLPMAITKYIAEYKVDETRLQSFVSVTIFMTAALGVFASILMVGLANPLARLLNIPQFYRDVLLLSFVFPFSTIFFIALAILNGKREMRYYSILLTAQNGLFLLISLLLLWSGWGLKSILIALWLSIVLLTAFPIFQNRIYLTFRLKISRLISNAKQLLQFGIKVVVTDLVNQVNIYADFLILGCFLSPDRVGFYTVAISISRLIVMIPVGIQKITYPAASEFWAKKDNINLNKMVNKTIKYSSISTIILGVGISFFAQEIIEIIFGKDFISAWLPMIILILGVVLQGALIQSLGGLLSAIGRPELSLKVDTLTVAINLGLNFILIPSWGLLGAAISKSISLIGNTIIKIMLFSSVVKLKLELKPFYLITLTAIPLFFVKWLFLIQVNSIISNSIVFLVYLLGVIILYFSVYKEDIKLCKSLLKLE